MKQKKWPTCARQSGYNNKHRETERDEEFFQSCKRGKRGIFKLYIIGQRYNTSEGSIETLLFLSNQCNKCCHCRYHDYR